MIKRWYNRIMEILFGVKAYTENSSGRFKNGFYKVDKGICHTEDIIFLKRKNK